MTVSDGGNGIDPRGTYIDGHTHAPDGHTGRMSYDAEEGCISRGTRAGRAALSEARRGYAPNDCIADRRRRVVAPTGEGKRPHEDRLAENNYSSKGRRDAHENSGLSTLRLTITVGVRRLRQLFLTGRAPSQGCGTAKGGGCPPSHGRIPTRTQNRYVKRDMMRWYASSRTLYSIPGSPYVHIYVVVSHIVCEAWRCTAIMHVSYRVWWVMQELRGGPRGDRDRADCGVSMSRFPPVAAHRPVFSNLSICAPH